MQICTCKYGTLHIHNSVHAVNVKNANKFATQIAD